MKMVTGEAADTTMTCTTKEESGVIKSLADLFIGREMLTYCFYLKSILIAGGKEKIAACGKKNCTLFSRR